MSGFPVTVHYTIRDRAAEMSSYNANHGHTAQSLSEEILGHGHGFFVLEADSVNFFTSLPKDQVPKDQACSHPQLIAKHTSVHSSRTTIHLYLNMSKLVDDVKSGLKGIRGAGDAVRGTVLEATDQALDNNTKHPATQESQMKNHAIAEKGKHDIRGADEMMARHEWQKKEGYAPASSTTSTHTSGTTGTAGTTGHAAHPGQL
ncbi:hypothetical protein BJ170DRAFT_593923 [Xylariales sp. AK1849]|nr:hypothetical protein BJ170DRAFT_593923 [Xylariales sp. AK1849]